MGRLEANPGTASEAPPTSSVIETIAEYEGVDPLEFDQPLAEVVDTDALDSIIGNGVAGHASSDIAIRFSYHGHGVQVSSDGSIEISSHTATERSRLVTQYSTA